ncbi:divalent-cation tolerance protein CutA [Desulfobulbus alkaliphilus]|uniref:divalent-cation tolerance protein CutA n=1 Tax=Desulfobulbus alkaliphilus TaxID=869814 RepID=UPI00196331B4|nr:divalent-cation tolerance protein CutA [Desulfobulbus alkaliphilus]MBM9535791.1 divalent-cation tolerance protein CutA [Desulfobulbus alkaliphilus]
MTPYIQVATTVADQTSAEQLATVLLEKKLAACIQIAPCTSMYRWQGKVEQGMELVCTIKTRGDLFPLLCRTIQAHHPYEVPEILATPVLAGAENYLEWMENELVPGSEDQD